MSNTYKDMPYWVCLNKEATLTDHDHLRFGKPIYKHKLIVDSEGNNVRETVPILRRALFIADKEMSWFYSYPEPVYRQAHELVNAGRGNEYVQVGEREQDTYERVVVGHVKDYCTEGEKFESQDQFWAHRTDELPCIPKLAEEHPRSYSRSRGGPTSVRRSEHDRYYNSQRNDERRHFKALSNRWNSGDDLEDWDENLTLTEDTSGYILW